MGAKRRHSLAKRPGEDIRKRSEKTRHTNNRELRGQASSRQSHSRWTIF